jgi:hypothetical protein
VRLKRARFGSFNWERREVDGIIEIEFYHRIVVTRAADLWRGIVVTVLGAEAKRQGLKVTRRGRARSRCGVGRGGNSGRNAFDAAFEGSTGFSRNGDNQQREFGVEPFNGLNDVVLSS